MPITVEEIKAHHEQYDIGDLETMDADEYRMLLANEALIWMDHHEFVRSTLSDEILATNREQVDMLIEHLKRYRDQMPKK